MSIHTGIFIGNLWLYCKSQSYKSQVMVNNCKFSTLYAILHRVVDWG